MTSSRIAQLVAALALTPWAWFAARDLTPRADAIAIGMPFFLVIGVAGALMVAGLAGAPRGALAGIVASWLLFAAVVFLGPWTPRGGDAPVEGIRLVAANVRGEVMSPIALGDLLAQDGDVVVVSEILPALRRPLAEAYPYAVESSGDRDVVVYARWPLVALDDPPEVVEENGVAVEVQAPSGAFVLYGLHLPPPGFPITASYQVGLRSQRRIINDLVAAIEAETRPVVVAGDLNLTDRGGGYRALAGVQRDAMRANWAGPTSVRWAPLLLRIDHILVPRSWCADDSRRFEITNSDHKGVTATIGACASPDEG